MKKGYWVSVYRKLHNADSMAAYAKLAGPAIEAGGGKFLARGIASLAYESGPDRPGRADRVRIGGKGARYA